MNRKIISSFVSIFLTAAPARAALLGYVVKADADKLYLDLGKASGVVPGQEFTVFTEGEELKHPVTGASLGRLEQKVAAGKIVEVLDAYSVAQLAAPAAVAVGAKVRAGDPPPPPAAPTPVAAPAPAGTGPAPLFRGPVVRMEAASLAVGDVDGDGKSDVILADKRRVQAFPWDKSAKEWKPLCQFEDTGLGVGLLSVEAADLDKDGRAEVFASLHSESLGRVESHVLSCKDGAFQKTATIPWLVRSYVKEDGSSDLAVQQLVADRTFPFSGIYRLTYADGKYAPSAEPLKHKRLEWLYSFGFASRDGSPLVAFYSQTQRIRLQFEKNNWYTSDAYGQTANRVRWHGRSLNFHPRLLVEGGEQGLSTVYTLKNIPRFGSFASAFAMFQSAELVKLSWNGVSLEPSWKAPIGGYAPDVAVMPASDGRPAELLTAVVGSDGRSAVWSFAK